MKKNVKKGKSLYNEQDFEALISTLSSEYITIAPENVEEIIHHWFLNISKSLNAERTVLFQIGDRGDFYISDAWTKEDLEEPVKYDPKTTFPYLSAAVTRGETIVYSTDEDLPEEADTDKTNIKRMGITSFLLFPLGTGDNFWGAYLFAYKTKTVEWNEIFINRLRFITHLYSSVIKREQDRKTLENKVQFESLLANLSRDFISTGSSKIEEKISYWLHKTAEILNIDRAIVFNLSAHNKFYISNEWQSDNGREISPYDPEELFPWMYKQLMNHNPVIIPDISAFPEEAEIDRSNMPVIGALSVLVLPLVVEDKLVGVLAFSSSKPQFNLTEEMVQRVQIVSQVFAAALLRQKTERRLAEEKERLAVTLKSIGDGVITTDIMGYVTSLNDEAEKITGWHLEEAKGKMIDEVFCIIDETTGQPIPSPILKVLQTNTAVTLGAHTVLIDKNSGRKLITDSGAPIKDNRGNIIGAVLVFRDVTLERKQESELLKLKKLESIGILAGGIAHDFNNILTGIAGNIDLAAMCEDDIPGAHKYLEKALKGCRRAAALTQKLLTFSKGGSPVKENASIAEIITENMDFILHGSKIKTSISIEDNLWEVKVDKDQISQVIQNIIINSMEAMPDGGIISVICKNVMSVKNHNKKGRYVQIRIGDTGTGISRENIEKIFDPYFSTKEAGSGLGLAVSFSIIKKHDGFIDVVSKPKSGTEIIIHIPVHETEKIPEHQETGQKDRITEKSMSILVMDDEEPIRNLLKIMLSKMGHHVVTVPDGKRAVEEYSRKKFDLVILDITIPGGMGGIETIQELKEKDPEVKALVSSGYSNSPVLSEYGSYGFSGALTKPFLMKDLKKAIGNAVAE